MTSKVRIFMEYPRHSRQAALTVLILVSHFIALFFVIVLYDDRKKNRKSKLLHQRKERRKLKLLWKPKSRPQLLLQKARRMLELQDLSVSLSETWPGAFPGKI